MHLKFFRSKKADEMLELSGFVLIELIILVIFIMMSMKLIDSAAESTTYEKAFLARHYATLTDAIQIPIGDVKITNNIDPKWFTYTFEENEVQVYDESKGNNPPRSDRTIFPILKDTNLEQISITLRPENKIKQPKNYNPLAWFYTKKSEASQGTSVKFSICKQGKTLTAGEC